MTPVTGEKAWTTVIGMQLHSCGIASGGVPYCWGSDEFGQLGDGGSSVHTESPSPVDTSDIAGEKAFVSIQGGWDFTCAVTSYGMAYCWGADDYGQLGNGGTAVLSQSPEPVDTSGL
jgi:alpha-tubulin suppressor-like RCC1 family protein